MTFVVLAALLSHNGGVFVVFQNPTNTIWPHLFWFLGLMHLLCSIRVLDIRYLCFRGFFFFFDRWTVELRPPFPFSLSVY